MFFCYLFTFSYIILVKAYNTFGGNIGAMMHTKLKVGKALFNKEIFDKKRIGRF